MVDGLQTAMRTGFRGVYVHIHSNGTRVCIIEVQITCSCSSEGGMFQFTSLRNLLAKTDFTGIPASPAPSVLVLDSAPGDRGVHSAVTSAALPVENPIKRCIFIPTAAAAWYLAWFLNAMGGNPPLFDGAREGLNSPELLPNVTIGTPTIRLYMYSDRDRITLSEDIEKHAEEARRRGLPVEMEKFERSWHITHAREYPERYWEACTRAWREASELEAAKL